MSFRATAVGQHRRDGESHHIEYRDAMGCSPQEPRAEDHEFVPRERARAVEIRVVEKFGGELARRRVHRRLAVREDVELEHDGIRLCLAQLSIVVRIRRVEQREHVALELLAREHAHDSRRLDQLSSDLPPALSVDLGRRDARPLERLERDARPLERLEREIFAQGLEPLQEFRPIWRTSEASSPWRNVAAGSQQRCAAVYYAVEQCGASHRFSRCYLS